MTFLAKNTIIYRQNLSFGGGFVFYQFQHFGLSEYFCKEYGENLNFPAHLHQSFELIMVLSGNMEITVDNKKYIINKNEAVLVFPNQLHSLNGDNCKHMLCIFSSEIVKSFSIKVANKSPESNKFLINKFLFDSIDMICEDSTKIKKKGILYTICSEFDDNAKYIDKKNNDTNLLYRIFEFVELNYNKCCSLEMLSKETTYSYSYLSRYFKNEVSMSFNTYVNLYRISKACYTLTNTNCSAIQCALECGYTSLRSFNRNFKLFTLLTPSEYRLKYKQ